MGFEDFVNGSADSSVDGSVDSSVDDFVPGSSGPKFVFPKTFFF